MGSRRITVLLVASILVAGGLMARLFIISILDHGTYVALARDQQSVDLSVLPKRGDIYVQDASNNSTIVAATSVASYALSVTPKNVSHKPEFAHLLAQFTGTDEQKLLTALNGNGLYLAPIKHNLSKEDIGKLSDQVNALEKTFTPSWTDVSVNFNAVQGNAIYFVGGIYFTPEYGRVYPEGQLLSQVLGFVNNDGDGQYGFEGQYDGELKGYAGKVSLEEDSVGTQLSETTIEPSQNGLSYELSIDRNVQYEVETELAQAVKDDEASGGSVIVMNPKTGEIMAMANTPSYDPNNFDQVSRDNIGEFDNASISSNWEPGSIFKPIVMGAAMNEGLVTPDTENTFGESVVVDGYTINTALRTAYGKENMSQVLANSDNVAMVWVADKLGNKNMYDYLQKFGFGSYTGIDLKNEIAGSMPALNNWSDIDRATISFGQGIAVTPLQMITAYAAIANDGKMVKPRIVHAIIDENGNKSEVQPTFGDQVLKPDIAKQLRDMMVYTVEEAHNRAGTPGYKVGGKTGTAQIPDPKNGGYIEDAYNHSFVGIAPSDDPKYVMLVKIDNPNIKKVGTYAESTAVPLFGKISTFLLHYYQIPPTNK